MRIAVDPTMTQLLRDVAAGIRVLQVRDGIVLSETQILERARNIVMGLIGNYRIEALERESLDRQRRPAPAQPPKPAPLP